MIREGLFSRPEFFEDFIPRLNGYGIFDPDDDLITRYIGAYHEATRYGKIEPMAGLMLNRISVYRINV